MTRKSVIIAGGGASGALVAANLLRSAPAIRVVVIDPRAELGRGMAYSTACPRHLLNVPACKMSAFPGEPRHFLNWLHTRGLGAYDENSFVPRTVYGDYLGSVLDEARAHAGPGSFEHLRSEAVGCRQDATGVEIRLADGTIRRADALVLATGNAAPAPWPNLPAGLSESGRYFGLVWSPGALESRDPSEPVLLLGTGLTAIDAVLALRHNGHRGPIHMISRRGLLPRGHRLSACALLNCRAADSAAGLARNMRAAAAESQIMQGNWRPAIDGVRPCTNDLWRDLPLAEQRRFLRHLRPHWDVHRHRMAPEIAAVIRAEMAAGTLRALAGRILSLQETSGGLAVAVRLRGGPTEERLDVGRIVNCTGPQADPARTLNPLIRDLVESGALLPHPLRTGVFVDEDGAFRGRDHSPSERLFAMGPLRLGTLIETVAMPEIRDQAHQLAQLLAGRMQTTAPRLTSQPFAFAS